MRGVAPAAISVSRAFLLGIFLFCTQPGRTCVSGLLAAAPPNRLGRLLQATTLEDASQPGRIGGMPSIGSPPVSSTVFGSSLGPGWAVKSLGSRGVRQQQVAGAVNNGSQAFCANLPAINDEVFFSCQNCSQNGYEPLDLNKTSGFQLTIRRTNSDYRTLEDPSQASLPDIQIQLGDKPSLCNFGLFTYGLILNPEKTTFISYADKRTTNSTRNDSTGVFTRKFLFQNYQACVSDRSSLTNVTGIGFSSNTANVSFCLEDFKLLPTQVPSTEVLANATAASYQRFPNCIESTPQQVDEDGYFLVVQNKATLHNITGTLPSAGYTVYPGIDVPGHYDMRPVDTSTPAERDVDISCSTNHSAPNLTQVNTCAQGRSVCCIDTGPYQSMFGSAQLPEELAKICNGLTINNTICQGFNYDSRYNVAVFKGQPPNVPLDLKNNACNHPGYSFWALNAALSTSETDPRTAPPPTPPAPPSPVPPPPASGSSTDKIGTAWGVAAAVVGPVIAIGTWFILTWTYRNEKKIITEEVIKRLKASDIGKTDSALRSAGSGLGYQAKKSERISAFHPMLGTGPVPDNIMRSGSFTSAVSAASDLPPKLTVLDSSGSQGNDEPLPETKTVARQITRRCLRRWDGLLGIRASSDSLGNRAGVWRDRYDTVRCAVLLLAFRKLNNALQANPSSFRADCPASIVAAWQGSNSHGQRRDVISWISRKVQEITEDDAQALADKDPEHPGFYDEMCNRLACCGGR